MKIGTTKAIVFCVHLCALVVVHFSSGCGRPDRANIALRQQIQELEAQISDLQRQRQGDRATIRALETQRPTVPTLPQERLESLFTTHGLKIGRLTGGVDSDLDSPGHDALRVYVVPTDQRGDLLKAAGAFAIDAFDLSNPQDSHLGRWEFGAEQAARQWFGSALMYGYVFDCPWQRPPTSSRLTVRVTFQDVLTGREFVEQTEISINPPASPATAPRTAPTTAPAASR